MEDVGLEKDLGARGGIRSSRTVTPGRPGVSDFNVGPFRVMNWRMEDTGRRTDGTSPALYL